jgi:hypothetical protein
MAAPNDSVIVKRDTVIDGQTFRPIGEYLPHFATRKIIYNGDSVEIILRKHPKAGSGDTIEQIMHGFIYIKTVKSDSTIRTVNGVPYRHYTYIANTSAAILEGEMVADSVRRN